MPTAPNSLMITAVPCPCGERDRPLRACLAACRGHGLIFLDGTDGDYVLHFDRPPPVKGFWSFTIYNAATRCLAEHPSGKFAVRQRDPAVRYGGDGSLTIRIRRDLSFSSPGEAPACLNAI